MTGGGEDERALLATRLEVLRLVARHGCHGLNNVLTYAGGQLSLLAREVDRNPAILERIAKLHEYLHELAAEARRLHDVARFDGQRRPEPIELARFRDSVSAILCDVSRPLPSFRLGDGDGWSRTIDADRMALRIMLVAIGEGVRRVAHGVGVCLDFACIEQDGSIVFRFRGPFAAADVAETELYRAAAALAREEGGVVAHGELKDGGEVTLRLPVRSDHA